MNYDQLASFEPALAEFLEKVRHCFKRDKTFGYLQKYILGLMADLKRKSIEPIALACGVAVRTLQEFLAFFAWDHERVDRLLTHEAVNRQHGKRSIGVLDASAHANRAATPPVFNVSGVAKPAKRTIVSLASTCFTPIMTPRTLSVAWWPAICIFPKAGMLIEIAAGVRAFRMSWCIVRPGRLALSRSNA